MKKSQTEILGLAIVVVIILVATIFIVKFGFNKPTNYRTDFLSSEIASNMINTLLKTNSKDCSHLTMTELLKDCAQTGGDGSIRCDNGEYSCNFVKSTANKIFTKTLDKWKMNYEFLAYVDENSPLIRLGNKCAGEKESKIFPIPTSTGTMYVGLDICV